MAGTGRGDVVNGHGPDTYVPTMQEAERDEHEHSRCNWEDPCAACKRAWRRPQPGVHG